jgi:TfoX/Sxy family transcriptional regulator of competence genes
MKMPKPTAKDRERFHALVPDDPRVEVKPMFGNLGAFVNGNMFMGLLGADVGLKLDEADRARLIDAGGGPFGPGEEPLGQYVSLPPGWSPAEAEEWVATSLSTVAAFPPKAKKAKKK